MQQVTTEIPFHLAQLQNFFGRQCFQELFLVILPFQLQLFYLQTITFFKGLQDFFVSEVVGIFMGIYPGVALILYLFHLPVMKIFVQWPEGLAFRVGQLQLLSKVNFSLFVKLIDLLLRLGNKCSGSGKQEQYGAKNVYNFAFHNAHTFTIQK